MAPPLWRCAISLPIARDAATAEAGLDFVLTRNTALGIGYAGQFATRARDIGAEAFKVKF